MWNFANFGAYGGFGDRASSFSGMGGITPAKLSLMMALSGAGVHPGFAANPYAHPAAVAQQAALALAGPQNRAPAIAAQQAANAVAAGMVPFNPGYPGVMPGYPGGFPGMSPYMPTTSFMPSSQAAVEMARGDCLQYGISATVAGGATVTLQTVPQVPHVPVRLSLLESVAEKFEIIDFRVGVEPILATAGANMSLAPYIAQATSPAFRSVPCPVGTTVSLQIVNTSGGDARFSTAVIGTYLPLVQQYLLA